MKKRKTKSPRKKSLIKQQMAKRVHLFFLVCFLERTRVSLGPKIRRSYSNKSELDKSVVMAWVGSPARSQMSLFLECSTFSNPIHLFYLPKICVGIVFDFSWETLGTSSCTRRNCKQ